MWNIINDKNRTPRLGIHQRLYLVTVLYFSLTCQWIEPNLAAGEEISPSCPEPRLTQKAPPDFYNLRNPLERNPENLKKGRLLYQVKAKPMACKHCHGITGDGKGPLATGINPSPRNFTCAKTINGVPDGQLFWVIKKGSPDTEMFSFKDLKDKEIWQLIIYIRELAQ